MDIRLRVLFLVLGIFILVPFCSIFVLLVIFNIKSTKSSEISGKEKYISYRFDPSTNSTSKSFTSLPRKLKEDESISYFTPSGNYILIAPVTSLNFDYECEATCVCYDGDESSSDRRSVGVLRSAAYYIVSAASLALAINYASDYFSEACKNQYSHVCADNPDEGIGYPTHIDPMCFRARWIAEEKIKRGGEDVNYRCKGECITLEEYYLTLGKYKDNAEMYEKTLKWDPYIANRNELFENCVLAELEATVKASFEEEAIHEFEFYHLLPFCNEIGDLEILHSKFHPWDGNTMWSMACFKDLKTITCLREESVVPKE